MSFKTLGVVRDFCPFFSLFNFVCPVSSARCFKISTVIHNKLCNDPADSWCGAWKGTDGAVVRQRIKLS